MSLALGAVARTIPASGIVTASTGPGTARETWHVERVTCQATGALVPILGLYLDSVDVSSFIDGTVKAAQNIAEYRPPITLQPGQQLWVRWSNGSPGAQVTMQLYGTRDTVR